MGRIKSSSKADRTDSTCHCRHSGLAGLMRNTRNHSSAIVSPLDLSPDQKSTIPSKHSAAHPFVSVMFESSAETAP